MPNSVFLSRRAEKFLTQLTESSLYSRLRSAIDELGYESRPAGCVKLSGMTDLYRIRVGDYRVVYQVRGAELVVLVLAIGRRRDVYRR